MLSAVTACRTGKPILKFSGISGENRVCPEILPGGRFTFLTLEKIRS
jgi:hypothetical protein